MKQQSTLIKIRPTSEDREKKLLRLLILKKRQKLVTSITKTEMLKVELEMVKQEYNVRVGRLYIMSNQQDLDIIYFQNLLELLQKGVTYTESIRQLDHTYYSEQRKLEEEKEKLRFEKEIFEKRSEATPDSENNDIKQLWKYLVSKFHPDLVQDKSEKTRRENIMKQVNRAYEERNYEMLVQLKNEVHIEQYQESTIEILNAILIDIENEIILQEITYNRLQESEWYTWKVKIAKAAKKNKDIFADIEGPLLNDIVRNKTYINNLKEQVEALKKTH